MIISLETSKKKRLTDDSQNLCVAKDVNITEKKVKMTHWKKYLCHMRENRLYSLTIQ